MKKVWGLFLIAILAIATGCASVPKESIELSVTVGRDLEAVHKANRNLAVMHFDYLLADVDRFVDEVYRPFIIEFTVDDLDLVADFRAALETQNDDDRDALDILIIYTEEVTAKIDTFRTEMRAPLEAQRDSVLLSIDEAFQQLQTANAVVTGHLASVRKVHDTQSELFAQVGLEDYRDKVAIGLASWSNDVSKTLDKARKIKSELDSIEDDAERIRRTQEELAAVPGEINRISEKSPEPAGNIPDDMTNGGIDNE